MNLLLHGLDAPKIDPGNALRFKLSEIGERDRVDMILTNPPFGGEEEKGIQGNFSDDRQTAETALLFLQLIMRKLRRQPTVAGRPARAAVVVPNGILYGDGVCARIKEELLKDFNLHTIVRLPSGVFAPYTNIPTNILFFDRSSSTSEIWYYEHALSEGRKNYTKTAPLQFEELRSCIDWWQRRQKDDQSWKVPVHEVIADGYNLDRKNPNRRAGNGHRRPAEIATDILTTERQILNTLTQLQELLRDTTENLNLSQEGKSRCGWRQCLLGECLRLSLDVHHVQPDQTYQNLGIYSFGRGLFLKPSIDGVLTSATTLNRVKKGQFIYSRLFAFEGAYGVVSEEFDGFFVSNEYPTFDCINERVKAEFLSVYFKSPSVWHTVAVGSKGLGDRRQRVQPQQILNHVFWLPPIEWQDQVVKIERQVRSLGQYQSQATTALGTLIPTIIDRSFGYL